MANFFSLLNGALALSLAVITIASALSRKQALDYSSASTFECGFEKLESNLFSLRYFMVALIFLLFDLEVLLLFPSVEKTDLVMGSSLALFLTLGLFWEWNQTMLDWSL